jgi:hypothetical protein
MLLLPPPPLLLLLLRRRRRRRRRLPTPLQIIVPNKAPPFQKTTEKAR